MHTRLSPLLLLPVFLATPLLAQKDDKSPVAEAAPRVVKLVAPRGVYADLAEDSFDLATVLLGGAPGKAKSFYEFVQQLDDLADDSGSDTILFDLSQPLGLNLAQMAETERCLGRLRAAKKKCIAYVENVAGPQLALASQCDEILMADMGTVDFGSLALSSMYMKDAFDLLGIQWDIVRCGDFKGAVEPYMQSAMSPHLRRHYEAMLGRMNDDVVRRIALGRGLSRDKVRELQATRLLTARDALVAGLVDRLVAWQGAERSIEEFLGEAEIELKNALQKKRRAGFNFMAFMQNMFNPQKEREEDVEDSTLVVLHMSGTIVDGRTAMPGSIVSGPAVKEIRRLAEQDNVRGVVVRINSPGGSATASEAIVLALTELAKKKPVVCSMGSVAASGGYYITCFDAPILAEPGTITGSIGVFGMRPNLGALMRRIGVREELIALDESAGMNQMGKGWSDADKALLQRQVDQVYDRFLGHVARARGMSREGVEAIAGGRVWSGEQAVARGLVHRIGGLHEALALAAEKAGIEGEDYELLHLPRPRNFMDAIAEELLDVRALIEAASPRLPAGLLVERLGGLHGPLTILLDAVRGEQPLGRVWAMMPAELRVH